MCSKQPVSLIAQYPPGGRPDAVRSPETRKGRSARHGGRERVQVPRHPAAPSGEHRAGLQGYGHLVRATDSAACHVLSLISPFNRSFVSYPEESKTDPEACTRLILLSACASLLKPRLIFRQSCDRSAEARRRGHRLHTGQYVAAKRLPMNCNHVR